MKNKYTTELTILGKTISVSTLQIIKKYRTDSYSSIRTDVINEKPVLCCNSIDTDTYENLLKCYEELINNNVEVQISENGDPISKELAYNWLNSMHDIDSYVDNDDSWIDDYD